MTQDLDISTTENTPEKDVPLSTRSVSVVLRIRPLKQEEELESSYDVNTYPKSLIVDLQDDGDKKKTEYNFSDVLRPSDD